MQLSPNSTAAGQLSPAAMQALQLLLARARVAATNADVVLLEQLAIAKQLLEAAATQSYVRELAACCAGSPGAAFFGDWQRSCDVEVRRLEARFSSLAAVRDAA